jgi:hypothetical protein
MGDVNLTVWIVGLLIPAVGLLYGIFSHLEKQIAILQRIEDLLKTRQ